MNYDSARGFNYKEAQLIGFNNGLRLTPKDIEGLQPAKSRWSHFVFSRIELCPDIPHKKTIFIAGHCGNRFIATVLFLDTGLVSFDCLTSHLTVYEAVEVAHHISRALAKNGYPINGIAHLPAGTKVFPIVPHETDPLSWGHVLFTCTDRGFVRLK